MRTIKLTGPCAFLAELFDELAFLVEFHNARVRAVAALVSVRDKNIAVRRNHHVTGRPKQVRTHSAGSFFSERKQHFSVFAELGDLQPFGTVFCRLRVCHPDVALFIHIKAVRLHEKTFAEMLQTLACFLVKLDDGVKIRLCAAVCGAAVISPHIAVRADVDARGGTPFAAIG